MANIPKPIQLREQKIYLLNLHENTKTLKKGDTRYLIPTSWWNRIRDHSKVSIPEINNSVLLDATGKVNKNSIDFTVSEEVWNVLQEW